ncbi:uncharacterized protein G2W53_010346 [Senna tora]|uniref:Uncharacterized protein n=1 Tax=Senna tora TaxID=362788 RepID=A0A835CDY1_9FABA|nr:uncharacterized protein G2W53_010346 [Senna tora]
MAWKERVSCLNIFEATNHGQILEMFTKYESKVLLRKQEIAVESQKHSRSTSQKCCCASDWNRYVRIVFAKPSGFDA